MPFHYSSAGILITRFIAYAYTYHYLNWFSKTSVIKWHEVSKPQLVAIFALWIIAVVLYYTDYRTGLMALYFLSFLHVVLEFRSTSRVSGRSASRYGYASAAVPANRLKQDQTLVNIRLHVVHYRPAQDAGR